MKSRADVEKWGHDMFDESRQGPKESWEKQKVRVCVCVCVCFLEIFVFLTLYFR